MPSTRLIVSRELSQIIKGLTETCLQDGIERVAVGAVITNSHNKVLIIRRSLTEPFMAGLEEIPSGTVEQGEKVEDALAREIMEETGLRLTEITHYLGSFDYSSKSNNCTRQLNFCVIVADPTQVNLNSDEHDAFTWIHSGALDSIECSDETKLIVNRCFQECVITG